MLANYSCDSFYVGTHLMLTLMKAAATRIGSVAVLACAYCSAKDTCGAVGSVTCIHGYESAAVLTTLASEGEVVTELVSLV